MTICEYVGEMEFPHKAICSGEDDQSVESAVREAMLTFRGEGEETEEGMWDYGETMAVIDMIDPIPKELAGEILGQGILPHWIEL